MSIETELTEITKVSRKSGEAEGAFLHRLFTKVNALSDDDWEKLSEDAQKWANAASDAEAQNPENPVIPNFDGEPVEVKTNGSAAPKTKKAKKAAAKAEPEEAGEAEEEPEKKADKPAPKAKAKKAKEPKTEAKPEPVKAKGKAKAKAKTASKGDGKGPGRPTAFTPDAKITILAKENPFREGSNSHKVFAMYKKGMTVADFEKAVSKGSWKSTPKMFLMVHVNRGLIKVG